MTIQPPIKLTTVLTKEAARQFALAWINEAIELHSAAVGRQVCDYEELLVELSKIEAEWIVWSLMWKHLGEWLSSGITVAAH